MRTWVSMKLPTTAAAVVEVSITLAYGAVRRRQPSVENQGYEGTGWSVLAGAGVNTTLEHAGLVLEQHHSSTLSTPAQHAPATPSSGTPAYGRRNRRESNENAPKIHEFAFESQ